MAYFVVRLVSLDGRVMPYLLPELGGLGDAPGPEVVVVLQREIIFLARLGHEFVNLSGLRRGWAP